jgi:hypothetical protein
MEETNLPVNYEEDTDDGYTPVETSDRTVVGNLIKYTSDNGWTESGLQVESNKKLAALAVNKVLQRWQEERVIETIAQKPLPDAEEMNAAIPEIEWDKGPDGKPRPPWQLAHIVYLLDIETCEKFTFVSASIGAKIAVCALQDRVAWMRKLRGADVVPQDAGVLARGHRPSVANARLPGLLGEFSHTGRVGRQIGLRGSAARRADARESEIRPHLGRCQAQLGGAREITGRRPIGISAVAFADCEQDQRCCGLHCCGRRIDHALENTATQLPNR